jgi:hypothetical protein
MVIFGAGASYDSLDDYRASEPNSTGSIAVRHLRPPLANELFQKRESFDACLDAYGECTPVVLRLRRLAPTTNLEHELEGIRAEADYDSERHVQVHAIRYYLRRVIAKCQEDWYALSSGVTNYAYLMDRLRNWQAKSGEPVRLVTFNYDTLLERACARAVSLYLTTIHSYVSRPDYQIFKPHGSVNWVRIVENKIEAEHGPYAEHEIIGLGQELRLSPGHHISDAGETSFEGKWIYPAIAIPVEHKSVFECPENHLQKLRSCLSEVTRLLVVGWRGTEQHFLKLWGEVAPLSLKRVEVVAGSRREAAAIQQALEAAGLRAEYRLFPQPGPAAGFSEFVTGPEMDDFLA